MYSGVKHPQCLPSRLCYSLTVQKRGVRLCPSSFLRWFLLVLALWWRGLCNSMKLWARWCRATQDGWVIVESSDKTWSTDGGNDKPLQCSCLENPMNSMKRQKYMTPEEKPPRSEDVQYAPGEEQRNSSRKNEDVGPKQKWCSAVDVSGGENKAQCCKEQYCIGTWNVRSLNQGKLAMSNNSKNEHRHLRKWCIKMDQNRTIQMTIISTTVGKNPLQDME